MKVRIDNGPEFISLALAEWTEWAENNNVALGFIEPGKPIQNSYIERCNRTCRHEVWDYYISSTLTEVRDITEKSLIEYNHERRHESLGELSP